MSTLSEFETDTGQKVVFETVDDNGRAELVSADVVRQTAKLSAVFSGIAPVLQEIKKIIDEVQRPGETKVEINIGFSATAGAFVASGEANASIKIALTWK